MIVGMLTGGAFKPRQWGRSGCFRRLGRAALVLLVGGELWMSIPSMAAGSNAPYSVEVWGVGEGLPDNVINAIRQTSDGYLWVSTAGGLVRFDGVRFRVFDRREPGLASDRPFRMAEGMNGDTWISMDRGELVRLRDGRFETFDASSGWPMERCPVRGAAFEADGSMVFATVPGGLWRFDGRHFTRITGPPSDRLPVGIFNDLAVPGWIWARTGEELFGYDGVTWTKWPIGAGAESRSFVVWSPRIGGGVWLLRHDSITGIRIGEEEPRVFRFPEVRDVCGLVEEAPGKFWIGTWRRGLVRLDGSTGDMDWVGVEHGFPEASVRAMLMDREGNLWVGTNGGGLVRVRPGVFRMLHRRRDFPPPALIPLSLAEDATGRIWTGRVDGGLAAIDGSGVSIPGNSGTDNAWTAVRRGDGRLWYGTYGSGWFARDAEGRIDRFDTAGPDPRDRFVRTLGEDADGTLWMGTDGGLWRWNDATRALESGPAGVPRESVQVLECDPSGGLWIGMRDAGLLHWREGLVTRIDGDLPSPGIRSLLAEEEGSLWIGTRLGLSLRRDGKVRRIDAGDRLGEAEVTSILDDTVGSLWLGSNRGVFRLSRAGVEAYLRGETQRVHPTSYGAVDGLPSDQSASGRPSALRARDGRLWFATVEGLAVVDPTQLPRNRHPPSVVVEEVLVDGKVHSETEPVGSVVVPSGPRRVDIRYTGISLAAPAGVRFRWRMSGFDTQWREVGGERVASFQGLPPGGYRFEVMAGNNDGVWSEKAGTMALTIRPAWWQTWWFRAAGGGALAGLLAFGYGARIARLERERRLQREFSQRLMESQEQERRRLAAELHDSLGQNLLVIKNRALIGLRHENQAPRMSQELAQVSELASQSLREVRAMAHELRPFQLDELGLTQAIAHIARRLGDASGIDVETDLEDLDGALPKSAEIHFFRSVQECLTNIAKHSGARTACVQVRREGDHLAALIRDDGCGFEVRAPGAGFGLRSLRERVGTLGGRIEFESRPGTGVRVHIRVPIAQPVLPNS